MLALLPVGIALYMTAVNPDYIGLLVTKTMGWVMLGTGAVLLVLKTFGLVLVVAGLRWALGRVSSPQCRGALLRVGLPAAAVLPVAAKLWTIGAEGLVLSAYRGVIALALFVATGLVCALVVRRLGQNLRFNRGEASINPWL